MKYLKYASVISLIACIPAISCARTVTFEEQGEGSASKYERVIDAQNRAEQNALSKALNKAGVDIFYGFQDYMAGGAEPEKQFISSVMDMFSSGVAQYERKGDAACTTSGDGDIKCALTLKGSITFNGSPDSGFNVDITGPRPVYCEGDRIGMTARPTKDSFLQIISIDEEKNTTLVYPSPHAKSGKIPAGETYDIKNSGLVMQAVLPKGKSETYELLQVIMTKDAPLLTQADAKPSDGKTGDLINLGNFMSLAKRLSGLNRSTWTMKLFPYKITRCENTPAK